MGMVREKALLVALIVVFCGVVNGQEKTVTGDGTGTAPNNIIEVNPGWLNSTDDDDDIALVANESYTANRVHSNALTVAGTFSLGMDTQGNDTGKSLNLIVTGADSTSKIGGNLFTGNNSNVYFSGNLELRGGMNAGTGTITIAKKATLYGDNAFISGAGINLGEVDINGNARISGDKGTFVVNSMSTIGGAGKAPSVWIVEDEATNFKGGITLAENGSIRSTQGSDYTNPAAPVYGGTVYFGFAKDGVAANNVDAELRLQGGTLDGSTYELVLLPHAYGGTDNAVKAVINVSGDAPSRVVGHVSSFAMSANIGSTLLVYGSGSKNNWQIGETTVTNSGELVLGRVNESGANVRGNMQIMGKKNITIDQGGTVKSTFYSSSITGMNTIWGDPTTGNTGGKFTSNGTLDLSGGNLAIKQFTGGVEINGLATFGGTADETGIATLFVGENASASGNDATNVRFGANASVQLENTFLKAMAEDTAAVAGNTIVDLSQGNGVISFDSANTIRDTVLSKGMFGTYNFNLTGDNKKIYVTVSDRAAQFDGTDNDYQRNFSPAFRRMYGSPASRRLGYNIYRSASELLVQDPSRTAAFEKHENLFSAYLAGDVRNDSAANAYVGAGNGRVLDVAMGTMFDFHNSLLSHHEENRREARYADAGVASGAAFADRRVMNTYYGPETRSRPRARTRSWDQGWNRNRFWFGGFGMWEDAGRRNGFQGYEYNSSGLIAGYDHVFGPVTVGGAFGYTSGDFDDKSAILDYSEIESYNFSLHGAYNHPCGVFATLFASYAHSRNDVEQLRELYDAGGNPSREWQRGKYNTNTWSVAAEAGYDFRLGNLSLAPSIGLTYVYARNGNHNESFNGVDLLRFSGMKNHALVLPVKLRAEYGFQLGQDVVLSLLANTGYSYNFMDDDLDGSIFTYGYTNAAPIDAVGRRSGHHTFNVGTGVKVAAFSRFDASINYDYYRKAKYNGHRLMGTVGFSF
ncbi:MAG: autotransporter domain-containing protein [Planctomycetes bacterium]|nr:autotransporter domain-containing protein [Planctomycetota bacterium]